MHPLPSLSLSLPCSSCLRVRIDGWLDGWGLAVVDVSESGRQGRASKQQPPPLLIALLVLFACAERPTLSDTVRKLLPLRVVVTTAPLRLYQHTQTAVAPRALVASQAPNALHTLPIPLRPPVRSPPLFPSTKPSFYHREIHCIQAHHCIYSSSLIPSVHSFIPHSLHRPLSHAQQLDSYSRWRMADKKAFFEQQIAAQAPKKVRYDCDVCDFVLDSMTR